MEVPRIDGPVIAFCGIARPEQFFAGLASGGAKVAAKIVFADHHRYLARDAARLLAAARSAGAAALVTTEKDLVRLGSVAATLSTELSVLAVKLRIEIEEEAAAVDHLNGLIREAKLQSSL
jgi:tetraacyldisaccharide 4'-kinase